MKSALKTFCHRLWLRTQGALVGGVLTALGFLYAGPTLIQSDGHGFRAEIGYTDEARAQMDALMRTVSIEEIK